MTVQNQALQPSPGRTMTLLVAGDLAVFFLFSGIGRLSHGKGVGIEDIGPLLANAVPFATSWFIAGVLLGAYRNNLLAQPRRLLARTLLAWAIALFPGVVLRMLILREAFPQISFAITTFIFVALFLTIWRLLFSWAVQRGAQHGN